MCENLRAVEVEATRYLVANYHPKKAQSPGSITQLTRVESHPGANGALHHRRRDLRPLGMHMEDVLRDATLSPQLQAPAGVGNPRVIGARIHETGLNWEADTEGKEKFDDYDAGAGIKSDLEMDGD
ncbi:hypothetical protein DFH11DRAFT_1731817 [Phellopilus nigrolimitatus]|nr:hypothetical protein DFH11DRAFT_1731817 [Phellopilus nigrolimitatus]